jgi:MFS family permease
MGIRDRLDGRTRDLLGNVGFRRLYTGHAVSEAGDELYFVAAMWLTFELSGSTALTGLTGFLSRAPGALGFLFGPLVDRAPLRRLLVASELLQAVVAVAVPVAAALEVLSVWVVLAVVPLLATLKRVSGPAQNAAVPRLVADRNLVRANSLTATSDRAVGAAARAGGGAAIALVGAVALFGVNAGTFLVSAVVFAVTAIPATEKEGTSPSAREYLDDVAEGVAVVRDSPILHMLAGASLAGLFTGMTTAVLPAFAASLGGPGTYGLLLAAMTAGTFAGALLASQLETVPLGRVTAVGFAAGAVCWLGAVTLGSPAAIAALFALAFVPVGSYNVLVSASLQSGVDETLLGRVSATTGSVTATIGPLGILAGGLLGEAFGASLVVGASAVGFALIGSYWALVPTLRRFPSVDAIEPGSFA